MAAKNRIDLYVILYNTHTMKQQLKKQIIKEEIQADLSFEDICPEWNDILAQNGGFVKNQNTHFKSGNDTKNIMNCANCLIGEAHASS